jgi:signal transduction histidine kinase
VVLAAAGLLSYWLAGRALKPLTNIAAETSSISAANLQHRVAVPTTGDEIARLAVGFNELLDRLQATFAELRRFTADASHELRTPLTVIRSVGEMALTKSMTPQQYRDTIGHMLEEADRLTQLVELLLMLARGEAGDPPAAPSPVVPVDLVKVVCAQLQPLAEELGQSLSVHGSADSPTVMNANLVSLAVFNVIHNAIKFTPNGGCIDIHVGSADSAISIVVDDTGPGIAANEREKVFDRFYRSNRVHSSMGRGFGLGLSIALSAVAKLGGTVTVGQAASGGARISIFIPKQNSAYS